MIFRLRLIPAMLIFFGLVIDTGIAYADSSPVISLKDGWSDLIISDVQVYESQLRDGNEIGDSTSVLSNNPAKQFVSFAPSGPKAFSFAGGGTVLKSGGLPVVVSQSGNRFFGNVGNKPVLRLAVEHDGAYSFTLYEPLDHKDGNDPTDVIVLNFELIGQDEDGKILGGAKISVKVIDDAPDVAITFCNYFESTLVSNPNFRLKGSLQKSLGNSVEYGADGNGYIDVSNEDLFASAGFGGERVPLTSNGDAIVLTKRGNYVVGESDNGKIFAFSIDNFTGKYWYEQYKPLDRPETLLGKPIVLNFGLHVHDKDGDMKSTFVTVDVYKQGVSRVYSPPES